MNTTPPPSDDDLPDERELAALYARLPRSEPDPALDAAVLARATRATPIRRRPRWPVALGSAAVLVLAVGVAWQVRLSPPEPTATTTLTTAAPVAPPPPVVDEVASRPLPAPPPEVHAAKTRAATDTRRSAPLPRVRAQAIIESSPVPAPAPPVPAEPAAPPAPPAPPSPPAPAAPAEPAALSAPPVVLESPGVSAPAVEQRSAAPVASSPRMAPMEAPQNRALRVAAPAPLVPGPDDRVAMIRRLLDDGQRDEAVRELDQLRRRFPRYPLPDDLRDLKR